jgi:PTS system cellobiose-specific IIB component
MEEAAEKKGINVSIRAIAVGLLEETIEDADVVLVGPQIKYKFKYVEQIATEHSIKARLIKIVDYGMVNGANVLKDALSLV